MKPQPPHIDPLFAGLNQHEATPPSAAWQQMEALLDAQAPAPQKKRVAAWWWAAAVLLPFLMGGFWFLGRQSAEPPTAAIKTMEGQKPTPAAAGQPAVASEDLKAPLLHANRSANLESSRVASHRSTSVKPGASAAKLGAPQAETIVREANLSPRPNGLLVSENALPAEQPEHRVALQNPLEERLLAPPAQAEQQTEAADAAAIEIASIEIRRAKTTLPATEIATVEWRPSRARPSLGEKLQRLRNTDPDKWPGLGQAKENLFAWIVPKR